MNNTRSHALPSITPVTSLSVILDPSQDTTYGAATKELQVGFDYHSVIESCDRVIDLPAR
jgi:hypothetical protein